jgi:predicted phage-related endonuclease
MAGAGEMNAPASITLPGDGDDAFRAAHVGASEVAALFDASPWLTRFELWHRKNGTIATPDFAGDERMLWGTLLEPVILDEACRRYGWELVETPKRLSNGKGFGGHPDRWVRRLSDGKIGTVEAKAVDWIQFKKWGDEPQLHYLLQPQGYCGLAGHEWCAIVALVGGNELKPWEFDFRPRLYAEIE